MVHIEDATGQGFSAKVNADNRLITFAITENEAQAAVEIGNAYNFNTGELTISGSTESAVVYLKNNETQDFVVNAIAVGFGSGTVDGGLGLAKIELLRNPTTGTIVDDATNIDQNENRNFGSSKTFDGNVYKGGQGKTFTNGVGIATLYSNVGGRLFAQIDFELTKGDTLGVKITPNVSTELTCYIALIGYVKDLKQRN